MGWWRNSSGSDWMGSLGPAGVQITASAHLEQCEAVFRENERPARLDPVAMTPAVTAPAIMKRSASLAGPMRHHHDTRPRREVREDEEDPEPIMRYETDVPWILAEASPSLTTNAIVESVKSHWPRFNALATRGSCTGSLPTRGPRLWKPSNACRVTGP